MSDLNNTIPNDQEQKQENLDSLDPLQNLPQVNEITPKEIGFLLY